MVLRLEYAKRRARRGAHQLRGVGSSHVELFGGRPALLLVLALDDYTAEMVANAYRYPAETISHLTLASQRLEISYTGRDLQAHVRPVRLGRRNEVGVEQVTVSSLIYTVKGTDGYSWATSISFMK